MAEPELSIHQQIKQAGNRVVYLPLESNPEIFTSLLQELGVVGFECQDIISLDPELLDFVPRPVQALILTFPARGDAWHNALDEREKYRKNYEGKGEEEEVVWFVQSIDNACGLYAILHAVCNGIDRSSIRFGSPLDNLLKKAIPLGPFERAKALEASEAIKAIHHKAAETGTSTIPDAKNVDYHFICFVKSRKNNHVYEMNGTGKGPIDTGVVSEGNDLLTGDALELVRKYIKDAPDDIGFSLIGLVPANTYAARILFRNVHHNMAETEQSVYHRYKQAGNRVTYLPLESNPETFTTLIQDLGVDGFELQDIISLDPELLDFVPRPVQALILTFPCRGDAWQDALDERETHVKNYEGRGEEEPVIWFAQTIQNACGLYAILHAVSNGVDRSSIRTGSPLDNLLKQVIPLGPIERAKALEASEEIKAIHHKAAQSGTSEIPDADDVDYHFICFVKSQKNNHVYEMNGTAKGPIDTGVVSEGNDLLTGDSLELVRKYMKDAPNDLGFSLIGLVPANA